MSLGCEVAAMAGLPESVIARAKELREQLQKQISDECKACLIKLIQ